MYERFTPEMRQVITTAAAEAERRADRHTGTEHLVLGLISVGGERLRGGVGRTDLTIDLARERLARLDSDALAAVGVPFDVPESNAGGGATPVAGRGRGRLRRRPRMHLPFTSGAKSAIERSLRVAQQGGDRHIGIEHLACVLSERDKRDPGVALLDRLDVKAEALVMALKPSKAA